MALNRDEILAANDVEIHEVEVPEWGGSVLVRPLTAGDASKLGDEATTAVLVALSCVDEDGETLFTEDDIPALEKKSLAALKRVVEVVVEINGLTDEALQEAVGN